MNGYYYDRREDETPTSVADAAFPALIQLFIPFPYDESEKNFKKGLYFFFDRELFAYTDVIQLSFYKKDSDGPPVISPMDALVYRFVTGYFLHCMINKKLSSCRSELHELTGPNPDTFLMDELFKAANRCCNYHTVQKWLKGTAFITTEGKYLKNSFLKVNERTKSRIFDIARSCRFILCDLSGRYEYSWTGAHYNEKSLTIKISIKYPLKGYTGYEEMVKGLLSSWGSRIFESFRKEILEDYESRLSDEDKIMLAVRSRKLDVSDISFKISENFFWKLLGLKRRNTVLSGRYATDLELMLYTLSVGENLQTYELLRSLRNKKYGSESESAKDSEVAALKKALLNYLSLGPERYMQALERLKDILKADVSSKSFLAVHNKVTIPNMPRMVMIMIALDRYTSGIEDIRRLKDSRESEMINLFREDFIKTEVTKLCLINREEAEILIETDRSLGAMKSDLIALKNDMPFPPPPKPDKKADDPEKPTDAKKPGAKKRSGPSKPSGKG